MSAACTSWTGKSHDPSAAAAAPGGLVNWTPVLIQTVMTIAVMVGVGLAVVGQVRWRATQEWSALAEARGQRIETLEADLEHMRAKLLKDNELQELRIQALEAQIAE